MMRDGAQILERLPGVDQVGQFRIDYAAVGVLDLHRAACEADDRMQDAETAAIGLEIAFGQGGYIEAELAVEPSIVAWKPSLPPGPMQLAA